jgi:hypothetical protein
VRVSNACKNLSKDVSLHYMPLYMSELYYGTVLCCTSYDDSIASAGTSLVSLIGVPHVLRTTSIIAFICLICIFAGRRRS